jgi:UrcA family protein
MSLKSLFALIALSGVLIAGAVSPALAAPSPGEPRTVVRVPYGDLDLAAAPGARVMLARIKAAADRACGGAPDIRELARQPGYDRCVRDASTLAVRDLHAPLVTAAFDPPHALEFASH